MRRVGAALAVVLSTCLIGVGPASGAPAHASGLAPVHRACGAVPSGWVRCFAEWRAGGSRPAATGAITPAVGLPKSGYGPADIASAYQLDTTRGSGQVVGIVDAFDNPKVESDLAAYRRARLGIAIGVAVVALIGYLILRRRSSRLATRR